MKKITVALLSLMISFGALFTIATPVYATEDCPAGSLQYGRAKYKTSTDGSSVTVTKPSNISVDSSDSRLLAGTSTILPSVSSCNMNATDLKNGDLMKVVNIIIDVILGVLGLVAVIFIILGGITYVTSTGDPVKVKKAKDTILYGIIGLVIALLAFAVVNFVLTSMSGN